MTRRRFLHFSIPMHHYANFVVRLLLLSLPLLLLAGCGPDGETWNRIQSEGVLRVGLDPTYPPFEDASGGELQGLDVDLARALGREMGVEIQFVHLGYDGLYDALLTGRVDMLLSALLIEVERTRDFAYSDPYFNAGQILIVPADSAITGMRDLAGQRVAVELGAGGHVEARWWQRRVADLTIETFDTPTAALTAIAAGDAEAALMDTIAGRQFLATTPGLRRLPEPVTVEPYAAVVRAGDQVLLEQINAALATLEGNGTVAAIERRWLEGGG
jgi:polar amino acid transport system substrate-binding protein